MTDQPRRRAVDAGVPPGAPPRTSFRSAVDTAVIVPLALAFGWTFPAGIWLIASGRAGPGVMLMLAGLLPLALFLPVRYHFDEPLLAINSGLFRWRIPYPLIVAVRRVRSARAAPALGRERLEIEFFTGRGTEKVSVSPDSVDEFVSVLRQRAPEAQIATEPA